VVSIWKVEISGELDQLQATPQHLVVGVPLGLQLQQLVSLQAPFLNTVRVTPGLLASILLSSMPYVGEVDLNLNSDPSNVALTATKDGFVVRGTVSGPGGQHVAADSSWRMHTLTCTTLQPRLFRVQHTDQQCMPCCM
jgi:hypothetical protein